MEQVVLVAVVMALVVQLEHLVRELLILVVAEAVLAATHQPLQAAQVAQVL
jgi:hypothetical protein